MSAIFQPPPTWAPPVLEDDKLGRMVFNPVWLNWFLLVAESGTLAMLSTEHNNCTGLQGGAAGEYYHLTSLEYARLPARVARGGLRKTTPQVIGNLAAAYVPITNYSANVFAASFGVAANFVAGTLTFDNPGAYLVYVNVEGSLTLDNNSGRRFNLRFYNVAAGAPTGAEVMTTYIGAYMSGFSVGFTIAVEVTPALVNAPIRIEVGGGDAFASFTVSGIGYTATSIDTFL